MTLPLSKEQIEAIQARAEKATRKTRSVRHTPFPDGWLREEIEIASAEVWINKELTPEILSALCQQALRAIELEAMFQFEGDDAAHMKPNDPALKDGIVVRRDHFDEMLKRQHSLQSELTAARNALEEERERCAKVCDSEQDEWAGTVGVRALDQAADRIRNAEQTGTNNG